MTDDIWALKYRKEVDKKVRAEYLAELKNTLGEDNEEYIFRKSLYDERYITQDGQEVDTYIRGFVMLSFYEKGMFLPGEKKKAIEEANKSLSAWHIDNMESLDDMRKQAVYDELFNMVTLYLSLCERDKSFSSLIFGLGKIKEDKLQEKTKNSVEVVSVVVPERLSMEKEFSFFKSVADDAFKERYGL
ncbi:MAG: hypothetical protein K6A69_06480 [Lachnospiraceae bacterium]|nr:hypothetical protein [Lachnospiraceae bacterium]